MKNLIFNIKQTIIIHLEKNISDDEYDQLKQINELSVADLKEILHDMKMDYKVFQSLDSIENATIEFID
jgi:hypothetical protein